MTVLDRNRDLLIVVTTHDKYSQNGKLERCLNSIYNYIKLPRNSYSILVVSDSTDDNVEDNLIINLRMLHGTIPIYFNREVSLELGVTISRLKGYLFAKDYEFKTISFIDADAYFIDTVDLTNFINNDDIFMTATYYGYNNGPNGITIVEKYNPGIYESIELFDKLTSDDTSTRDYNVFMGRFFKTNTVPIEAFVDTKMFCDDSTFYFLYLYHINTNFKGLKFEKITASTVSDSESDRTLSPLNIDVGYAQVKWICYKYIHTAPEELKKYVFRHQAHSLMFSYLSYTHAARPISGNDISRVINATDNIDIEQLYGQNKENLQFIRTHLNDASARHMNEFYDNRYAVVKTSASD